MAHAVYRVLGNRQAESRCCANAPISPMIPITPKSLRRPWRALSGILALLFACSGLRAAEPVPAFALHDGDRVVFYGDSITQDGGYPAVVEAYCRDRFPTWDLRFYNSGVGGDTVKGGGSGEIGVRIDRDVIRLKPTVVTLMLGMNDGRYRKLEPETLAAFTDGYRNIVKRIKDALPGVRIYLIRSSPFDDVARPPNFEGGYMEVLRKMGDSVAEIGREQQLPVVDFGSVVASGIGSVFRKDPDLARLLLPDRVHPSPAGHIVMGATLLRAWQAPALVSRVEIDAHSPSVVGAENASVSALVVSDGVVKWTELDGSLPLPLDFADASTNLAQLAGADLDSIDSEPLVVSGLRAGRYELRIDDQLVGVFLDSDLAKGVNLARYNTPMRWQANQVRWAATGGHEIQRLERHLLYTAAGDAAALSAAAFLSAAEEKDQSSRSHPALPKERHFALSPLP
jgi:lysophospholipase L1-like esterase